MRLFKPASQESGSPIDEELFLRAARAYALRRYPNPERKGCPRADEIGAIARRQVPLSRIKGHIEHIATCSPCLSDYLAAREGWEKQRRYRIAILAAVAGVVVAVVGVTMLRSPSPPPSEPPPVAEERQPDIQLQAATLDLRPLEPTRGEAKTGPPVPVLARANLRLTLLLPVGSGEGDYEFEIRDERGELLLRGSGSAIIRDYITTIETDLDLRSIRPGRLVLAIRRGGDSAWRTYSFEVQ